MRVVAENYKSKEGKLCANNLAKAFDQMAALYEHMEELKKNRPLVDHRMPFKRV